MCIRDSAYAAQGEEYERKCFLYASNAQMLGIAAEQVPFSSNAIAVLDAKIRETEALIRQQEEQAYISRCVDEAMKELGYTVVGCLLYTSGTIAVGLKN